MPEYHLYQLNISGSVLQCFIKATFVSGLVHAIGGLYLQGVCDLVQTWKPKYFTLG